MTIKTLCNAPQANVGICSAFILFSDVLYCFILQYFTFFLQHKAALAQFDYKYKDYYIFDFIVVNSSTQLF